MRVDVSSRQCVMGPLEMGQVCLPTCIAFKQGHPTLQPTSRQSQLQVKEPAPGGRHPWEAQEEIREATTQEEATAQEEIKVDHQAVQAVLQEEAVQLMEHLQATASRRRTT